MVSREGGSAAEVLTVSSKPLHLPTATDRSKQTNKITILEHFRLHRFILLSSTSVCVRAQVIAIDADQRGRARAVTRARKVRGRRSDGD